MAVDLPPRAARRPLWLQRLDQLGDWVNPGEPLSAGCHGMARTAWQAVPQAGVCLSIFNGLPLERGDVSHKGHPVEQNEWYKS